MLLKDNILTDGGMPTAAGAAALADFKPTRDATIVRLRQAGAVILDRPAPMLWLCRLACCWLLGGAYARLLKIGAARR